MVGIGDGEGGGRVVRIQEGAGIGEGLCCGISTRRTGAQTLDKRCAAC